MRSVAVIGALAACAAAQLMPINDIANVKFPASTGPTVGKGAGSESFPYNAKAAYQSTYNNVFSQSGTSAKRNIFQKRHDGGDCSPQPLGAGPVTNSPDTPEAFLANPVYSNAANSAQTPDGWVNTFTNQQASSQVPMGYLGYDSVSAYDPSICAAKCNALTGCFAFDLYFERDPTIDPGDNCTNPASTTIIKCAYWGTTLTKDTATNDGQYCADFHIVIAGSNGYQKKSFTAPGYGGTYVGNAAINAPTECNSYIGYQLFNDGLPFDPSLCAAACDATSAFNIQYLNSRAICRFFDTYILNKNGVPQGQYCAMYTRSWDLSYATNTGQTDSEGNVYTISYSYIYSNTTDPGAQICDAKCMSQSPCPISSSSSSSSTMPATSVSSSSLKASSTLSSTLSSVITSATTFTTKTVSAGTTSSVVASSSPSTTKAIATTWSVIVSSSSSTTKAAATTWSVIVSSSSSTTKAAATTWSVIVSSPSSTTKAVVTTTSSTTTTKATTASATPTSTTTKCTTTTFQTSTRTTAKSTTTTASPTPTSTKCFWLRASGSSYLQSNSYLSLDRSGKLIYAAGATPQIFGLDSSSRLTCADTGKTFSRTVESWSNPSWGYMSTNGMYSVTCSKGSNGQLSFNPVKGTNGIWSGGFGNGGGLAHGSYPGNGWDQAGLFMEYVNCPPVQPGSNWAPWMNFY